MVFHSLSAWLAWQETLHPLAIDLGLERVASVFCALQPHYQKPLTITVAGTNGKGSCIALLEAMYRAQGYKVGAYSSPNIIKYNERIKIDGQPASDELICGAFERIEAVRHNTSLSYFEFGTLAALDLFARARVDIQLLEVGMGGRLDAVNIVDANVALISSIGIDHVEWLGNTREAIAKEKAGVFRAHAPAVIGDARPPQSLLDCAAEKQALLHCISKNFSYHKDKDSWTWRSENLHFEQLPKPTLKGEHQYRNASAVICAVTLLSEQLPISEQAIRYGLSHTQLLGRFQLIENQADVPVLLDVGHNPEAVKTLVDYLNNTFPNKRIHAVFAMMKDKDISAVLKLMQPIVHHWFIAPLANPRAANESLMREIFTQNGMNNLSFGYTCFKQAFDAAKNQARRGDLLLVFGSFFLVSDCLVEFEKK
ncbi:MAG: bifunctional tetrahydrofolate synthase/dihydrofolate synthase [Methylococcaceae bacterium]